MADYERIRGGLQLLCKAGVSRRVFGAEAHGFRTHPPLTEPAVRALEADYGVVLPPDYRGFLLHVGNGGAGPYYGLFKLGEMDDGWGEKAWQENDTFVGTLSRPFPHTTPWNDLSGRPADDDPHEGEEAWEAAYNRFDEKYWSPENVHGAIPLCHLGCALRQWLVVTGPEAGDVCCDNWRGRCGKPTCRVRATGLELVQEGEGHESALVGLGAGRPLVPAGGLGRLGPPLGKASKGA